MATPTISNSYVGDGSTVLYSFTFPYIEISDVKVQVDEVITTEYAFANATTVQFNTAPAVGAKIRIYRDTSADDLKAVFFPGSAIRARDLNDNFTQSLYVSQESIVNVGDAVDSSQEAIDTANAADAKATQALTDSAQAKADAAQAALDAAAAKADADQAAIDAAQASSDAAEAKDAADAAEQYAEDIAGAVLDGGVLSVNGKTGLVTLGIDDLTDVETSSAGHTPSDGQALVWDAAMGHWMPGDVTSDVPKVEELADFAYYPEEQQVTLVGPNVADLAAPGVTNAMYRAVQSGGSLFINYLATNTGQNAVFEQLTEGDAVTCCYYTPRIDTGVPVYVELAGTFKSFGPNTGSDPLESFLVIDGAFSSYNPQQGDYAFVIKSPFISNGFKPISTGQALIYDQTTATWRPEDVSLNIGSLPTLP